MRAYRVIRAIDRGYPLAMFWLYVAAFVLAMSLMFVFPPGSLIMVGLGLASLALVVVVKKLLAATVHWSARASLGGGTCPACGEQVDAGLEDAEAWRCRACAARFLATGAEVEPA